MLLTISGLLNPAQLSKIHALLDRSPEVDGRTTAGFAAARVKVNHEIRPGEKQRALLNRILMASLGENAIFRFAVLPHRVADPIFSRYRGGQHYGDHVDDPIMGSSGPRFRTDVSMTIFLSGPEAYQGGELVVRTSFGEQRLKLAAGDAVTYPASSLHHVAEVTGGERRVALLWVQSYVRDPARRELLYELNQARETLLREAPEATHTGLVDRSYANLVRMWSDL